MPSNYNRKSSSQRNKEKRAKKHSKERSKKRAEKERTYEVEQFRKKLHRLDPFFYNIMDGGYNRAAEEGLLLGPFNDMAYPVAAAEASSPLSPLSFVPSPLSSQMSSPLSSLFSSPSAAPDNSRLLRVSSFASDVEKEDRYIPYSYEWKKYNSAAYPFSSP